MGDRSGRGPAGSGAAPLLSPNLLLRSPTASPGVTGLSTSVSRTGVRIRSPFVETFAYQFGGLLGSGRELTRRERRLGREIFGESIDFGVVRIVNTSVAADAPVTLGDNIRTRGRMADRTLIHELAHVWQYQNGGGGYISDSAYHQLHATVTTGDRSAAYSLAGVVREGKSLSEYTAEQQAMIVETYFADASRREDPVYQALIEEVRSRRPLPRAERRLEIYREGLFGPGYDANPGWIRPLDPLGDDTPMVMPLLRIEFP